MVGRIEVHAQLPEAASEFRLLIAGRRNNLRLEDRPSRLADPPSRRDRESGAIKPPHPRFRRREEHDRDPSSP